MISMKFTIQLPVALLFNLWIYAFKYLHYCQFRGFATKLEFIYVIIVFDISLFISVVENVTLIGHNWGFLAGIHVLRKHPEWFDSLIILNTNNLPDVSFHEFNSGFLVEFFTVTKNESKIWSLFVQIWLAWLISNFFSQNASS